MTHPLPFPLMTTTDVPEVTMDSRKPIWKELLPIAAGQALCVAIMIGIFALLGYYDSTVLLGGISGGLIALANFFFMTLFVDLASKKAEAQDVAGGQKLIQFSYMGRMAGILIALILLAKSGICNVLALAIPLVFNRPILTVYEFIRKKGGSNS